MPYAHIRNMTVERNGQLTIEGLPLREGQRVKVLVLQSHDLLPGKPRYPLHGETIRFEDPFTPAADSDDWEANR